MTAHRNRLRISYIQNVSDFCALYSGCRPHEGADTGELQPHQGRSEVDCGRRTEMYCRRPGTGDLLQQKE